MSNKPEREEPEAVAGHEPTPSTDELAAEVEALRARVAEKEAEVAQVRQAYAVVAADLRRTRERLEQRHARELERARLEMTRALFDVADNLDRMVEAASDAEAGGAGLRDGLRMVRSQFYQVLSEFGLERDEPQGEPFDPSRHEAVGVLPVPEASLDGRVVEVLQPGYRAGDTVLRPARVHVGRHEANEEAARAEGAEAQGTEGAGDDS